MILLPKKIDKFNSQIIPSKNQRNETEHVILV